MHAEHENLGGGLARHDAANRIQTADPGHRQVQHDHVRLVLHEERIGAIRVGRLGDHMTPWLLLEQATKARAHDRVIIHQHDADIRGVHAAVSLQTASGTQTVIRVPRPDSESMWQVPPRPLTRSRIPVSPSPRLAERLKNPAPSSDTTSFAYRTSAAGTSPGPVPAGSNRISTSALRALACTAMFVRASCTTR